MDPVEDHEAAKRELIRGKQLLLQLKATLQRSSDGGGSTTDVLMEEISVSLNRALNTLSSKETRDLDQGAHRAAAGSSFSTKNERSPNYNIREENVQKILTSKPFEDHHSWKKYGQKTITGAKNPRSYFKCSLRKDQGCKALKQVQQTETDPTKFIVTYIGNHSCTLSFDPSSPPDRCFLSFGHDRSTTNINTEQVQNWPVGASYATRGVDSEMINSSSSTATSPNPSDSDLMASFFESSFFYDEYNADS